MKLIFNARLNEGVFPDDWEQSNLVPIQQQNKKKKQKEKKRLKKIYEKISTYQYPSDT